jgi:hypothetical protein
VLGGLLWVVSPGIGIVVPAAVSLPLAMMGVFLPAVGLKAEAAARRRGFRHAFGSFLDVVSVSPQNLAFSLSNNTRF